MTRIANICRLDMGRQFARGHHIVMTANARALYFVVIHAARRYRYPRAGCGMTGCTQVRGIDVIRTLA